MKILIVGPTAGGINIYTDAIIRNLKNKQNLKIDFFSTGLNQSVYNPEDKKWLNYEDLIIKFNERVSKFNWNEYDYILLHYGKNDVEQLVPIYLENLGFDFSKLVYFVHYLSWNLFSDYIINPDIAKQVKETTLKLPNLFFFGTFAKDYWIKNYSIPQNYIVDYLPETHSNEVVDSIDVENFISNTKIKIDINKKTIIWAGYPSNYKNHKLLLDSIKYLKTPLNIIFAGRGWGKRIDKEKYSNQNTNIDFIDRELNSKEYRICSSMSDIGVFLYQQPENTNEVFQGSGTLPNYIYAGKPCIVLDEGSMAEYVKEAGVILKNRSPRNLAISIDAILSDQKRYSKLAFAKRSVFSQKLHANRIYNFLEFLSQ